MRPPRSRSSSGRRERQDAACVEARTDLFEVMERPPKQASHDENDDRKGDLRDQQHAREPQPRHAAAGRLQSAHRLNAGPAPGRRDAEEHRAEQSTRRCKCEDAAVGREPRPFASS